ncbi:sensor histidine kinase [Neobacillus sp. LXY-4]|uniref:sensor histidine kinase n=1 Tax=Neobacillus sp. LXY-4 TaxID=3379826 RepID=UPI003EE059FB
MKLKDRINLYTTVVFILLLIVINGVIYFTFSNMMLGRELERAAAEAKQAIEGINGAADRVPTAELLRAYVPINGMLQIVKADGSRGTAVTVSGEQGLREQSVTYYSKEVKTITVYDQIPHAFISIPIVWTNGEVANIQVTENLKATVNMLRILRIVLIAATVFAIIPVVISSRLLSNFISQPITSLIKTMREIRESGRFKTISLQQGSKDELYQMGDTFNKMIELLEVNYEKQGQFISNASHEMKTPITIIESYASLLKRRGFERPELYQESIHAIHSEAIRMKDMIEQLLLLAKQDEQWNVQMKDISLTNIVKELVQTFQKAYHRKVELQIDEEVSVKTDLQKFRQLLYILIDNARKYSEDVIKVRIRNTEQKALVEICDNGIGIPAAELDKIFDRFYRVDKARTRKEGGFGLGLSLAKEIAEAIKAEIQIESEEGNGTRATIVLLLSNPH